MDPVFLYTLGSVIIVSIVSFVGLFTLSLNQKRLKQSLVFLVAFAAGALWGDALIHLLPEAVEEKGFGLEVSLLVLSGVIVMFVTEKIIHWRHCHYPEEHKDHKHAFAYVNLVGDGVHNFIDGIIIAAAYITSIPVGIATTLAVVFHEIPQEIGDFGVLIHGGFKTREALRVNFMTALAAVVGALIVLYFGTNVAGSVFWLVPFAAGNFLYIAGSDLIPELHKEVEWKKSVGQLLCFFAGIGVMILLLGLE